MMNRRFSALTLVLVALWSLGAAAQSPTPQPTPVAIKIDGASFDPFAGQYEDAVNLGGLVFSFFREGEKFYVRLTNQDKIEILPQTPTKFFLTPGERGHVEFVRDGSGRVTGAKFNQGAIFDLKKIADTPAPDTRVIFKRTEAMIPMRDGVRLFTVILTPEVQSENLPIYMERTPYGVAGWSSPRLNSSKSEFVKDGYIFVFQDIRGREDSEGVFEMLRLPRDKRDPKSVDESTDTYDTIEYLIKNVPRNNGRVGIAGVSYPGWLAAVALIDPHPALKASSPQAPVTDLWMGDDFMHHGAFRQTYAHEWAIPLESAKKGGDVEFDNPDMYQWYLPLGKLQTLAPDLAKKSHSWKAFLEHPSWDEYWQARATNLYLKDTSVPTLIVGGWWDQEDLYGPLAMYKTLEKTDKDNQVFLVMGPWNHGGWGGRARRLGAIDFGSDTGNYYRREIQAPFFAKLLKDTGNFTPSEATVFQSGSNRWMTYDAWAPKNTQKRELYLHAGGKLSFDKPNGNGEAFDTYVSDPTNPVPYRRTPIKQTYTQGSTWGTWLVDDQRFLADRKDVLSWQTDALADDVTITGDVIAKIYASTSGSDSDWVVKLIDVYPPDAQPANMAGYQLMVSDEIFRGRYRKSFEKAEAIKPNKVEEYEIDLRGANYTFKKGHRIMVQIQSSWFPLYDRNPQTFVPNIFKAQPSDFKSATQRIYRSAKQPSHIAVFVPR
ncbi:MAG TPA: CocE/NonD family hydrolase [Pyrinomonadaceae bacterium]|nr:CocE/NonD family hydrolase [Pyrinomonadaceae bacterium]